MPGTDSMPYNTFDSCTRIVVAVRHPLVYCNRMVKESYDMVWLNGDRLEYKGSADFQERTSLTFDSCGDFWSEYHSRWLRQAELNPGKIVFVNSDKLLESDYSHLCEHIWQSLGIVPLLPNGAKDGSCPVPSAELRAKKAGSIHQQRRLEQRYNPTNKERERKKNFNKISLLLRTWISKSHLVNMDQLSATSRVFCYLALRRSE